MTEYLNHLACLIVEDLYGTFLAHLFEQLVLYGRLSLSHIAQRCHLPVRQAKTGLAALTQLRLVQHFAPPGNAATYQANVQHAYGLVRIGKVAALARSKFGSLASEIIEYIGYNGFVSSLQLEQHLSNFKAPGEKVSKTKVNRTLQALATHAFIRRIRPAHLQILHDVQQDVEYSMEQQNPSTQKSKNKKTQELAASLVKTEIESRLDLHLDTDSFGEGKSHVNGTHAAHAAMHAKTDAIYVGIDFDVVARSIQQDCISDVVTKALGHRAGQVMYAAIEQLNVSMNATAPTADVLRVPETQTLVLAKLRESMHTSNGTSNGDASYMMNGNHADAAMTNGAEEDEDQTGSRSDIEASLSMIAEGPYTFISHDESSSTWNINSLQLSRWIRDKELDQIIRQQAGPIGLRLKRILTHMGKLEEKNIQDLGLLVAKELRQVLARMEKQGLVQLQEVPRDPQRQPNRTMFLWFFDAERAKSVILSDIYKTMARLYQVIFRERNKLKGTFDKLARAGVNSQPEEHLIGEERMAYLQWRREEKWMIGEIERLDDSVALLGGI